MNLNMTWSWNTARIRRCYNCVTITILSNCLTCRDKVNTAVKLKQRSVQLFHTVMLWTHDFDNMQPGNIYEKRNAILIICFPTENRLSEFLWQPIRLQGMFVWKPLPQEVSLGGLLCLSILLTCLIYCYLFIYLFHVYISSNFSSYLFGSGLGLFCSLN